MYTLQQQVFTLSLLSNKTFGVRGTSEDLVQYASDAINYALNAGPVIDQIGNWKIVWGPAVFESALLDLPVRAADHTAVVFQGSDGGNAVFVVSIAGTNKLSRLDWLEDLLVRRRISYRGAEIAQGTLTGVHKLEGMKSDGKALPEFIHSQAAGDAKVIFAGHSLGGALAPALALDLVLNDGLDLSRWEEVLVYPSAGPTPGNQAYSELFAKYFGPQQPTDGNAWNAWNMNVVNTLDIVPRAWNQLATLPTLYPQIADPVATVQKLVNALATFDDHPHDPYVPLPSSSITGTYSSTVPYACRATDFQKYEDQALYQHIGAYVGAIIPDLNEYVEFLVPGPCPS